MDNKKLKMFPRLLLSLILALLIWYSVNGNTGNIITRYIMNIPVTVTNESDLNSKGLIIDDNASYFVNLQIRGTEDSLDDIDPNEITAQINLADVNAAGEQSVPVVINGLNNTVILDQTIPSSIELQVNEITAMEISPTILTQGKPEDPYTVISSGTTETVTVNGPKDQLDRIKTVSGTAKVDGISENSYQFVELKSYDEDGNVLDGIEIIPNIVQAEVLIGATKQVATVAPEVSNAPQTGYKVVSVGVSPSSVRIAGDPDIVNEVNTLQVSPITIDDSNSNKSFTVESDMIIPDGISIIGSDDVAAVKVGIEKINQKEFNVNGIDVQGLDGSLNVSRINPATVQVILSGTSAELAQIDNSEVKATVDLTGLGAGQYVLPVNINVNNVNIISVTPQNVEVVLTQK